MNASIRNIVRLAVVAGCAVSCHSFSVQQTTSSSNSRQVRTTPLHMAGFPQTEGDIPAVKKRTNTKKRSPELSAVAITAPSDRGFYMEDDLSDNHQNFFQDWMLPVLSTSFLITANTVGATCLVIPDLAAGPGFGTTCALSVLTYGINLVSGMMMAEVAIKQYESSGSEVASSFKEFADSSFKSSLISNAIACISILTNASILAFTFNKAGDLGSELLGGSLEPATVSIGYVGLVGVLMSSLSGERLSAVASLCVAGLFASFAGLLLPGLAAVQDPMATLMAPGVADNCLGSAAQLFPILLLSLVYQNIVPSVTKLLNYDRKKTTASLAIGSFIPFAMYVAWCFASMGGGIDTSLGMAGPLLTGFSMATVAGSSIGTTMSVAEEFDSFLKSSTADADEEDLGKSEVFSVPAVAASVAVPTIGALFGGDDITMFLGLAGSIGTPLLYGVVPALMAWKQRQAVSQRLDNLVPGGMASLGALGLASTGFVGQELVHVMSTSFMT